VNSGTFFGLHTNLVIAMQAYFVQAEKTCAMLAQCTAEPLSLMERFNLISQEIVENEAHVRYVAAKTLLDEAARLGYRFSS
jgi:hypothetical protein